MPRAEIHLVALCLDCRKRHEIRATPVTWLARLSDWREKHLGHRIEFRSPRRRVPAGLDDSHFEHAGRAPWWLEFKENADVKMAYGTEAALTITLASLATSSTLTVGVESTAVDNSSNLYLDYVLAGKVTTGTSPTDVKTIQVWLYGQVEDTPAYPDVMDGTNSAETVTSADIRNAGLNFHADTATNDTSDRTYWFRPASVAASFGGLLPQRWGIWVTHDTAQNLNSTGGNHAFNHHGAYLTSA
jgi:hypothetical protein